MPRRSRLIVPDQPHHVIQRGHNRARTFHSPGDFTLYLGLLNEHAGEFECAVHAYVLMPNHVHLLLTPRMRSGMSRMMAA
jgi:putative transposase